MPARTWLWVKNDERIEGIVRQPPLYPPKGILPSSFAKDWKAKKRAQAPPGKPEALSKSPQLGARRSSWCCPSRCRRYRRWQPAEACGQCWVFVVVWIRYVRRMSPQNCFDRVGDELGFFAMSVTCLYTIYDIPKHTQRAILDGDGRSETPYKIHMHVARSKAPASARLVLNNSY